MKPISIYIHIPFCKAKCLYCDFTSFANCNDFFESYTKALCTELELNCEKFKGYEVKTIYVGGGTPTVLPYEFLKKINNIIFSEYNVFSDAEITIEANPGTINKNILNELKKMNFNRISLGLQAWQNRLLNVLGRIYTIETFKTNYNEIIDAGFENINLDLMFSLPNQTVSDWEETLKNVVSLDPSHISAYSLIIEENTPFFTMRDEGTIKETDELTDRQMYYFTKKFLGEHGYGHYEISNFSKKGKESRHNLVYWKDEEYLGFGLGSHSFLNGQRFHNTYDLKKYILLNESKRILKEDLETLSLNDMYCEFMFMGLRLMAGVEKERFFNRFGKELNDIYKEQILMLVKNNLLIETKEAIFLSEKGIDVSNYVFRQFFI